jgi:hypothetical protein
MKKIFIAIAFIFYCHCLQAQNNLQFNKVFYLDVDSLVMCSSSGVCVDTVLMRNIVVPAGKVLKIESINFRTTYNYLLFLNLTPFGTSSTSSSGFPPTNNFPIWLPAGTHKIYFYLKNNPASTTINFKFSYTLSGLEFNVVE